MRHRVQIARGEALETERVEQARVLSDDDLRNLASYSDHLVSVVRVENRLDVRLQVDEDGDVVGGERADTSGAGVLVDGAAP
jgi:hypothetical protein